MTEILTSTSEEDLKSQIDSFCIGKNIQHISFNLRSETTPKRGMEGMKLSDGSYAAYHHATSYTIYQALIIYGETFDLVSLLRDCVSETWGAKSFNEAQELFDKFLLKNNLKA
jgi:hypothetical protein